MDRPLAAQSSEQDAGEPSGRLPGTATAPFPNAITLPAHVDDTFSFDNYEEVMQTFSSALDGFSSSADPWAGMPPMEQLTFDLLDYTWEAPILWQNGETR